MGLRVVINIIILCYKERFLIGMFCNINYSFCTFTKLNHSVVKKKNIGAYLERS